MSIVCYVINGFIVVLFARAILSWFPLRPGGFMAQLSQFLIVLTDWALRPLRALIPPAGMFDLSFMVLIFGLFILSNAIC